MSAWAGKWALVTGASSGIGLAIAEELAAGGAHLVLTARRRQRLLDLASRLRAGSGVRVEVVTADLLDDRGPAEIFAFTESRGITLDLLVNNAGFGTFGEFAVSDATRELGMVRVNCSAVVHLTRLVLPGMVERKRGDILIVSSAAGFQPVPYAAIYAATKAFDLHFAEALAREVARHGIRVCALCPGRTTSEFHEVAGFPKVGAEEPARTVARRGLAALASGRHWIVSGIGNRLGVQALRIAPRGLVTRAAERIFRPDRP